jgi:hypothetical protein
MTSGKSGVSDGIIRSYEGIDLVEDFLENMEFYLRSKDQWLRDQVIEFIDDDLVNHEFKVRLDLSDDEVIKGIKDTLKKINFEPSQVILAGLLRFAPIKNVVTFYAKSIEEILKQQSITEIPINFGKGQQLTSEGQVSVEFVLLIGETKKSNFPYPTMKATWLSQKSFLLRAKQRGKFRFDWFPLTLEERKNRNLGKNSVLFVEHLFDLHERETLSECLNAFIDEEVLRNIKDEYSSSLSKFLWSEFTIKVLHASLIRSLRKIKAGNLGWNSIQTGSVMHTIVKAIVAKGARSQRKLDELEVFEELASNPESALEFIEDLVKSKQHFALLGRD